MNNTLHGYIAGIRFLQIDFIGGPYDGHQETSFMLPDHLPAEVVWFVCENVFRLLDGKDHGPNRPITSVALYELDTRGGHCRYRFGGAMSVKDATLAMTKT